MAKTRINRVARRHGLPPKAVAGPTQLEVNALTWDYVLARR